MCVHPSSLYRIGQDSMGGTAILQRNPLVQLARHISHGMLDPDRDPPYLCRNAYVRSSLS